MILLIDNYDSFTYNLYQYIGTFNDDIKVVRNDKITIEEIEKMNRYGKIYTIMLIATAVSAVPLFMLLGVWALIPWCIIWGISMYFAFMLEKI